MERLNNKNLKDITSGRKDFCNLDRCTYHPVGRNCVASKQKEDGSYKVWILSTRGIVEDSMLIGEFSSDHELEARECASSCWLKMIFENYRNF